MMVLCHKKGIVTVTYCQRDCPDWVNAKENNIWGNSTSTCEHFGRIVRSKQETAEMGAVIVPPGTARHEKLSKTIDDDRDEDHDSIKKFSISVPLSNHDTKFKPRRVVE